MSHPVFSVRDGALAISSGAQTGFAWQGCPDGLRVVDLRVAVQGDSAFILLDPPRGTGRVPNLVRVAATGSVIWRGELPDTSATDSFVSLELDVEGDVIAGTWSGYRVRLDPDTGRCLDKEFTK